MFGVDRRHEGSDPGFKEFRTQLRRVALEKVLEPESQKLLGVLVNNIEFYRSSGIWLHG
jgi:hypothetical protein